MSENSVICSSCNESYDSYLEKCPKCGALNNSSGNHVFNSNVLLPPSAKQEEAPAPVPEKKEEVQQQISLTAIANDPTAKLDPNNLPTVDSAQSTSTVEPINVPEAKEEEIFPSLAEAMPQPAMMDIGPINPEPVPPAPAEPVMPEPLPVAPAEPIMPIPVSAEPSSFIQMPTASEMAMVEEATSEPEPVNTNQSLTEIANNYKPANTDIFSTNIKYTEPERPTSEPVDPNNNPQIGVPPVTESKVVDPSILNEKEQVSFSPEELLIYAFCFLIGLSAINMIFLFMGGFSILMFFIRIIDLGLSIGGFYLCRKGDKRASFVGIGLGARLVLSIINVGIIDFLLGIAMIGISVYSMIAKPKEVANK